MKISIAMATYNGERFLREQLDSLAAQTLRPNELVVSDDCSTDNTIDIIKEWARTAPFPVRVYRNAKQLGYSRNFAKALTLSHSDYIFMSDQDDIWYKEKIHKMMERMSMPDHPLVVICDQMYANQDAIPTGETVRMRIKRLWFDNHISGCATGFDRSLLSIIIPVPEEIAYDSWIHKVGNATGRTAIIEEPLQIFRRHDKSIGSNIGSNTKLHRRRVHQTIFKFFSGYTVEYSKKRICIVNVLIARFDTSIAKGLFDSEEEWATCLFRLRNELKFLSRRLHNLYDPFPARCVGAVLLWRAGGYHHASGWRSLLKDCLLGARGHHRIQRHHQEQSDE